MDKHLCVYCGQYFKTTKSIDFHMNVCIYYQYNILYTKDVISHENIKYIVNIYDTLELYKLSNTTNLKLNYDNILISSILDKLSINQDSIYKYYSNIHDIISNIQTNLEYSSIQLDYISYEELIIIISKILNIPTNTFCNVINAYNKCCDYFKF
jgi:hypothetical protein